MKKRIAMMGIASASAVCLVAGPAVAQPHAASRHTFTTTLTPSKNVKPGTTIKARGKSKLKNTAFFCIPVDFNTAHHSEEVSNTVQLKSVKSSKTGVISCNQTFKPFSGVSNGKTHACPPSAADKKAHWTCAIVLADQATMGVKAVSLTPFTAKK